jgi:putative flippase GtrA
VSAWLAPSSRALVLQAMRFGLVGVSNTALTFSSYAALVWLGAPAPGAAAVGFALGAANGYRLNRGWTFRVGASGRAAATRYVLVALLGTGLDAGGVATATGPGHLPRLAAQVVVLPAVSLLTFGLCRRWVFGPGGQP